jgi:hypothetical protein
MTIEHSTVRTRSAVNHEKVNQHSLASNGNRKIAFYEDEIYDALDTIKDLIAEVGSAHVYRVFPELPLLVVSPRTLARRTIKQLFWKNQIRLATQEMHDGATPQEIRDEFGLSGKNIGRIAKNLGIKLSYRWFTKILATERQRETARPLDGPQLAARSGELTPEDSRPKLQQASRPH